MNNLPLYISLTFGLTTLITVFLFFKAANSSRLTLSLLLAWLIIQTLLGLSGFYTDTRAMPPRLMFLGLPPLLFIMALFATPKGRIYIDGLNLGTLTILHTIRIPVEIVLLWLFLHGMVPKLMTFDGRNFDVLAGLSAPVVFYFVFFRKKLHRGMFLLWNLVCLGLLLNIILNAVLSAPVPFQKFAFDQPNIAVLYFPFVWLPSCVVPLVLLSHLAAIRKLYINPAVEPA
jgi:hypothetical protein